MEATSTVSPLPCNNADLAYAQIVHMPIVLLCLLITESFYGAQIAGLHCIATKLESNNYPMCLHMYVRQGYAFGCIDLSTICRYIHLFCQKTVCFGLFRLKITSYSNLLLAH